MECGYFFKSDFLDLLLIIMNRSKFISLFHFPFLFFIFHLAIPISPLFLTDHETIFIWAFLINYKMLERTVHRFSNNQYFQKSWKIAMEAFLTELIFDEGSM